jgi:2,3-dimethylmalate lyase
MGAGTTFRAMGARDAPLIAIGAYDAYTALLVEQAGSDVVYLSGYMASASYLGMPDLGLITATERLASARQVVARVRTPVIADADQGFGNEINVKRTIEQFEAAGLAGIHLDDEVFPGKCQTYRSLAPTPLVSIDEMCEKVHAAVHARRDPDFVIIVRSDVFGSVEHGSVPRETLVSEAIERLNAYADAGAEMAFVYAESLDELDRYAASVHIPLVGLLGFIAPFKVADFAERGYRMVICPLPVLCAATKAIQEMLRTFKSEASWPSIEGHLASMSDIAAVLSLSEYSTVR